MAHRPVRALRSRAAALRALVRTSEVAVVALAAVIGALVGVLAWAMGTAAHWLHVLLYGIGPQVRLSAALDIPDWRLVLVPALGGLVLAGFNRWLKRRRPKPPVDPIEANALHGGRLSLTDAAVVGAQTILSNGAGASVGLEAGYAQAGGGLASRIGLFFALRRGDLRVLVGAGTAGAIAAAFDAPLTGAFYAFELVIGSYSIGALFPVMASAVSAVVVARALQAGTYAMETLSPGAVEDELYPLALLVGVLCGLSAILLMRGVAATERLLARAVPAEPLRLVLGGLCVGILATVSTVAMSAGHGALHLAFVTETPARLVLLLILVKALASIASVASGFRGGLFFASILIGALGGKLFAGLVALAVPPGPDPLILSIVGMSAFGAAVIGAPLAMTFLALETTGSLAVTGLVLAAVLVAGLTVRRLFGYSFATWRFHLRGETIRSAHDVGWINDLTAGRMMRRDPKSVPADLDLAAFRKAVPLGSAVQAVLLDADGRYAGIVSVPEAHAAPATATLAELARHANSALLPGTNARDAMKLFEAAEAEALAVVDGPARRVLGLLTEAHLLRRYGEEIDRLRREETGIGPG
ncbi:chloride channel protein [Paracraurococcus ruber]|uniref:Chloride channel protein n=1 Tax=Paracraurococcus ruber TaxID=77675 RepID=A0ABS1CVL3_9PROT|nr:chloride channel protein [Paracraurococcus ruber]MBK1658560.1 chloride channel protein [Paracraurococcus ruber]TDG30890.1 chloride channel protein [Paracraurococcus ruber]